jgi:hypothetical protein
MQLFFFVKRNQVFPGIVLTTTSHHHLRRISFTNRAFGSCAFPAQHDTVAQLTSDAIFNLIFVPSALHRAEYYRIPNKETYKLNAFKMLIIWIWGLSADCTTMSAPPDCCRQREREIRVIQKTKGHCECYGTKVSRIWVRQQNVPKIEYRKRVLCSGAVTTATCALHELKG